MKSFRSSPEQRETLIRAWAAGCCQSKNPGCCVELQPDILEMPAKGGVDVNHRRDGGCVPTIRAAQSHKLDSLPILIPAGADFNATCARG
jgi:hypothetical protein